MQILKRFLIIYSISASCLALEPTHTVALATTKLKQLDKTIHKIQKTLASTNQQKKMFETQLAFTEKQLTKDEYQLKTLNQTMGEQKHIVGQLQQKIAQSNQQLHEAQQKLIKQLLARQAMGHYQPLQWVLKQHDPYVVHRLLTFYQYIIKAQQNQIAVVRVTQKKLQLQQAILGKKLQEQKQVSLQLHYHQTMLEQDKHTHENVLQKLDQTLHSNQQQLAEANQNKANLALLLNKLAADRPSIPQMTQLRKVQQHSLTTPVETMQFETLNQGIAFFANEGTPVKAAFYGKIVFSDWLNGYGLLTIIDHGNGFMTLYAHNQSLVKYKGARVKPGETIASVGHSGSLKKNGLYFEVRVHGKAVPPKTWLA